MGVRLEPIDEYMHELGPEPNFNESMYFNVYDPKAGVGGWFRCGNRANEGHAEMKERVGEDLDEATTERKQPTCSAAVTG